jgi:hypothetical protein
MTIAVDYSSRLTVSGLRNAAVRRSTSSGSWYSSLYEPAMVQTSIAARSSDVSEQVISAVRNQLYRIAELPRGWDGGTASPVDPKYIQIVMEFVSSRLISSLTTVPDVVPTFEGGLQIEWHNERVDLIIELGPVGTSFYYFDNENNREIEAPISEGVDELSSAFLRLGLER